jgi:hypothetical protein
MIYRGLKNKSARMSAWGLRGITCIFDVTFLFSF